MDPAPAATATAEAAAPLAAEPRALAPVRRRAQVATWARLGWLLPPLLAVAAYWPALRVGFLADDYIMLYAARHRLDPALLLPNPGWFFYRPFGTVVTWYLGWRLWGLDPLPYHLLGLLAHAGVALAVGLVVAAVAGRRGPGWLAGALFAVFPLHLEAVGWLAAQWDAWAALFGILGLGLFVAWWRRPGASRGLYAAALLCYGLGLFSKENMLIFLPLYPLAAVLAQSPAGGGTWRRLGQGVVPFLGLVGLNLGLRLAFWGNLGGYPQDATIGGVPPLLSSVLNAGRLLLAPLNLTIFDPAIALGVGAISGLGLLAGLIRYGRRQRRLLAFGGAWLLLGLAPVLVLPLNMSDLGGNRFLYVAVAGYCAIGAALLYPLLADRGRGRLLVGAGVAALLLAGVVVSWVQLGPWQVGTTQATAAALELRRLIPPQPRPRGMVWYVENGLMTYRGVYVLWALGNLRYFTSGEGPLVKYVVNGPAQLGTDTGDEFALRFAFDAPSARYHVDRLAGLTADSPPPEGEQAGAAYQFWDFRNCAPAAMAAWTPTQAQVSCAPGVGLQAPPTGATSLQGPALAPPPGGDGARFLRLRVAVQYPAPLPPGAWSNNWTWASSDAQAAQPLPIKPDGAPHIYWTFIPLMDLGTAPVRLRFAPANGLLSAQIRWIALDWVQ